jgi:hypothetical protein
MKKTIFLLFTGLSIFLQIYAQEEDFTNPNPEPIINKLNQIFKNRVVFSIEDKKDRLTMDFYSGSEIIRKDNSYIFTIDKDKIYFSKEEKAIILKCRNDLERKWKKFNNACFERHIYKNDIIDNYARCNIDVEGMSSQQINEAIELFKELVEMYQQKFESFK